jgi:uncharacterized protein YndB with AHSA1/START domain
VDEAVWTKKVQLEHTIEIDRSPSDVFGVVADPRTDSKWCPRVTDCTQVGGAGLGPGARFETDHHPSLQPRQTRYIEILSFEPPTRVTSIQRDEIAGFTVHYELEPAERGTRLTQRDEIDWNLPWIGRPIGRWIVNRHMGEQLQILKEMLEDEGSD